MGRKRAKRGTQADQWVVLASVADGRAAREQAMTRLAGLGATVRQLAQGPYPADVAADDLRIEMLHTGTNGCIHRWSIRKQALRALAGISDS